MEIRVEKLDINIVAYRVKLKYTKYSIKNIKKLAMWDDKRFLPLVLDCQCRICQRAERDSNQTIQV